MPGCLFDKFSKIGGRCLTDLTIFHYYNYLELGGSSLFCHSDHFLEAGGKLS